MTIVVFAIFAAVGIKALYKYYITPKRQATLRANNPLPVTENIVTTEGVYDADQKPEGEQFSVRKDSSIKQEDNDTPYSNHQIGTATTPYQGESGHPAINHHIMSPSKSDFQLNQGCIESERAQLTSYNQAENQPWSNSNNNQAWESPQRNQNWEVPQGNQPWKNTFSN